MVFELNEFNSVLPNSINIKIEEIYAQEATNANGKKIKDKLRDKRVISLTYSYIYAEQATDLLNAIKDDFFPVTYLDPESGVLEERIFEVTSKSINSKFQFETLTTWTDLTFTLEER